MITQNSFGRSNFKITYRDRTIINIEEHGDGGLLIQSTGEILTPNEVAEMVDWLNSLVPNNGVHPIGQS
jgi:hypothetical protein